MPARSGRDQAGGRIGTVPRRLRDDCARTTSVLDDDAPAGGRAAGAHHAIVGASGLGKLA